MYFQAAFSKIREGLRQQNIHYMNASENGVAYARKKDLLKTSMTPHRVRCKQC